MTTHAAKFFWSASVLIACLGSSAQAQQEPKFEHRDLKKLSCRVVSVASNRADHTILDVVVSNTSDLTAEPLSFTIEADTRAKKNAAPAGQRFARARLPLVGRFGAGIAPGKSAHFQVQAALPKGKKPKVQVASANFYRDAPSRDSEPIPKALDLKPSRGTNDFLGQTFDTASFSIHNPLPRSADIWVRARYRRPLQEQLLLAYRVRAGETRQIQLGQVAPVFGFDDSDTVHAADVEIVAVEVVDWIQVAQIDHSSAKEAFMAAYSSWHCWPDNLKSARANFSTVEVGQNRFNQADVKLKMSGTIRVGQDRQLAVTLDKRSTEALSKVVKDGTDFLWSSSGFLQQQATRFIRRRAPVAVAQANDVRWVANDQLQLLGPSFDMESSGLWTAGDDGYSATAPRFALDSAGRIVGQGWGSDSSNDWTWTPTLLGQGWVLAQVECHPAHSSRGETETWKYALYDGHAVPSEYRRLVTNDDKVETSQTLKFSNWELELHGGAAKPEKGAVADTSPIGEGVAALEQAWAKLYQFPVTKTRWVAEVAVETNGTDLSWQGHNRFRATMTQTGFGFVRGGLQCNMHGAASPEVEAQIGDVYLDRLGMWYGSDPQSMGPFATAFAGATIGKADRLGWHPIAKHPITRIRVTDGRVSELELNSSTHRRFHYEDFEGVALITRIERDVDQKAEVLIRPTRFQEWIVPTRYEFRRIFGSDWGPEIFVLSGLKLRD